MAINYGFIGSLVFKLIVLVGVIIILTQINAVYASSYKIIFVFIFSGMTLIYLVASVIINAAVLTVCKGGMRNFFITEAILSCVGLIGWLFICGISGNIALRSGQETSIKFGAVSLISGAVLFCFVALVGLFVWLMTTTTTFPRYTKGKFPQNENQWQTKTQSH